MTSAPGGIARSGADLPDPLALDQDHLVRRDGARFGVDEPPGADGDDLLRRRRRGLGLRARGQRHERVDRTRGPTTNRIVPFIFCSMTVMTVQNCA